MIEAALVELLTGDTALGALIGDRLFPVVIPEQVDSESLKHPAVVYQRIGTSRSVTFCRTSGLVAANFQIDCYSKSYLVGRQVAAAVRVALLDFTGTVGGVHIDRVMLSADFDSLDPDPGLYRASQTFDVWHWE